MADSYSVKAVLSAQDKGFSSTLKSALGAVEKIGDKLKNGFAFGILTGVGQQAFSMLTNGARELVGEVNNANKAWKTFDSNLTILGKSEGEINKVKSALQAYAQESIYSSSDMASTYAQLAAVGIKSADKLVTGFGGLAAAAENPTQAMKTLSQQAVQMAAKPAVAWADFKLMLEQTPAGLAAVAKEMGMTTSELVTKVQDGELATKDFFAAIEKVGNSKSFANLATSYKGVDEAMAGLQETLGNKLTPAFDVLSQMAIGGLESIIDKVAAIDGEALAKKVSAGIEKAKPYWEAFKDIAAQVGEAIKAVAKFFADNADSIAKALPYIIGVAGAFKAFKVVSSVVPGFKVFTAAIGKLAGKGIAGIAAKLFGVAAGEKAAGAASKMSAKSVMAAAKSFLMMSAAVLLIAAGFAVLAFSAIALANAGWPAIAVMGGLLVALVGVGFGMAMLMKFLAPMAKKMMPAATAMLMMGAAVVLVAAGFAIMAATAIALANAGGLAIGVMVGLVAAMALLAIGAAALAPALTAGAVGLIAFGAAIVLVGVGAVLAAASLAIIAAVLPTIAAYGIQGATAIAALGASMTVFAAGAGLAGTAALIAGADMIVFGAGMTVGAAGTLLMVAALKAVQSSMKSIASSAKAAQKSLGAVIAIFNGGSDGAYAAGAFIGMGFAQGMLSMLGTIRSAAAQMAAAADAAVRAKAQIHSPSKASAALGEYWGIGFADGIADTKRDVWNAAEGIVAIPNVATPKLSGSYSGEMSADFDYFRNAEYIIEVPLNVDGRAFARATAGYTQNELDRRQTRDNRNHGRV